MTHPRNPRFKTESLTGLSWTRVVRDKYPYAHLTICCDRLAQLGDYVITVPVVRDGATVATAIIHSSCLRSFLERVPDDHDHDLIEQRWEAIRERFTV